MSFQVWISGRPFYPAGRTWRFFKHHNVLQNSGIIWTYFEPRKSYFWFRLKQIQLDLDNNKNDSSKHGGMVISPSFGDLKFILIKKNQEKMNYFNLISTFYFLYWVRLAGIFIINRSNLWFIRILNFVYDVFPVNVP